MLSARAKIDLAIRTAIEKQKPVPRYGTSGDMDFWRYIVSGACLKIDCEWSKKPAKSLPAYVFDNTLPPVVAFSGGVESTYLAASLPSAHVVAFNRVDRFRDLPNFRFLDKRIPGMWMEGSFAAHLGGLGYRTVVLGTERHHGVYNYELSVEFELAWQRYSGQTILTPLRNMYKDEIARALATARPDLYARVISCDRRSDKHCGRCAKCHLLEHVSNAIGFPLGVPIKGSWKKIEDFWFQTYMLRLKEEYGYTP